jgi:orotidine-5'-phosphate decarboxylase
MAFSKKTAIYCLHSDDWPRLTEVLDNLREVVDYIAVGVDLHLEHPEVLEMIHAAGLRSYAHFLYYDIKEVVTQAISILFERGYDVVDVHAFCGSDVIQNVKQLTDNTTTQRGERPQIVACALLPSQLGLPWQPEQATLSEAANFTTEHARTALEADIDGVLIPHEIMPQVSAQLLSADRLISYANPGDSSLEISSSLFYDWHVDEDGFWATQEGVALIQARRAQ